MTATIDTPTGITLKLPDLLRSYHDALLEAVCTPMPMEWDDETTYVKANQPAAIGAALVRALFPELANAEIGYLFRKKMSDHDKTRLAQASRVSGKLNYFTQLDCLVEVNWEGWQLLTPERRIALIDHELCHFSREIDDTGGTTYKIIAHDVEEFSAIVRRWGLWKRDLERFGTAVEKARQLDIFASPESRETKFPETTASFNGGPSTTMEDAAQQMGEAIAERIKGRNVRKGRSD